ncbi:hypothetical protein DsansV1_C08g0083891 [Dioscorea sansibarensis]
MCNIEVLIVHWFLAGQGFAIFFVFSVSILGNCLKINPRSHYLAELWCMSSLGNVGNREAYTSYG